MRRWLSRLSALLLTLVMLLGLMPTLAFGAGAGTDGKNDAEPIHVYTEEENALLDNGVFAEIQAVKDSTAVRMGGVGNMTEANYVSIIPQVISAIENSDTYVPGTLQRNGNFLVWQTTVGIPCCYSPRMEAKLHSIQNDPRTEEIVRTQENANEILDEIESVKGGWPSSTNIGLIQPFWESTSNYADSSFNSYSPSYKSMWQSLYGATGGSGMRYSMSNATIDNIAKTIQNCAIVIVDSHGDTDYSGSGDDYTSRANTSYICLTTTAGITSQDTQPQTGPYGTYYHCMKSGSYGYVDGTGIGNHMSQDAPNSLVYLGICLGMATSGMHQGLREKGVEAVWGYSQSVSFVGEEKYMKAILGHVKDGDDFATAVSKAKAALGKWDPAYSGYTESQAVADHVAFPICVSSEDAYPGHGKVDAVQTVYSTWTLYSQFEITALSNNEDWGTVSVSGRTIKATPAVGYYTADYEIVSGTATVTKNGDVFQINASSDCTIRIIFAARTPATITFSVPEGVTCEPVTGYVDDKVTLPTPVGEVKAGRFICRFVGWTTEPLDGRVTQAPDYLKAGTSVTMNEPQQTFYALYTYFVPENGAEEGQFRLVKEAPASWEGEFVISYDGVYALNASGTVTGTAICTSKGVITLADVGVAKDDTGLSSVPESMVFRIESSGSGVYAVKMQNGKYLSVSSNSNILTTDTAVNSKSSWIISMQDGHPILTNVSYSNRSLQFNDSSKVFRGYENGAQQPLTLYSAVPGTTWFTTAPAAPVQPLTAPELTVASVTSTGKNRLTWTAVSGADSYNVYRAFSADGPYALMKNTTGLSFIHDGGKAGKTYFYKVCAVRGDETGPTSTVQSRICHLARPVVSTTHVAATGKNMLTWEAVDGAVAYKVYRSIGEDGSYGLLTTTTSLSFIHAGSVAGKTYYYKVVAVGKDTAANSAPSVAKSAICRLARPKVTVSHVASTGKNMLTWAAVDGAVAYKVYRSIGEDGTYGLLTTTTSLSFIHAGGVAGKTYFYKVIAVAENTAANSAPSVVKSMTCGQGAN